MNRFSILFSIALFAACGVSPSASPTTYQEFMIAQSQISCEAVYRCCGTACLTDDAKFNRGFAATQKLIDLGKVVYDGNAGKTCLDSMRARATDCEFTANTQPSQSATCAQVLVGKVAVGQSCDPAVNNLCVANAYCDSSLASPVCTSFLSDGASCATGGSCLSTSYCDEMSQACKPHPKSGQACSATATCDSTGTKLVCLPSMVCGPPAADGAACTLNTQCMSGSCSVKMPRTCLTSSTPPKTLRDNICIIP